MVSKPTSDKFESQLKRFGSKKNDVLPKVRPTRGGVLQKYFRLPLITPQGFNRNISHPFPMF